ncbi:CRE-UNC-70 protein [Anopheles sinensis]|uniref:CRE-UNC-70 protein n=1 Tax=Anopheles sinensis TaxID=74873 RepID=A0A084WFM5_ANOSI|nr:CRE-UNC-70 protein [Anopheles sinensis]
MKSPVCGVPTKTSPYAPETYSRGDDHVKCGGTQRANTLFLSQAESRKRRAAGHFPLKQFNILQLPLPAFAADPLHKTRSDPLK